MKLRSSLSVAGALAAATLAGATGSAAGEPGYYGYGGYGYGGPLPPRPIPNVAVGPTETIVTTTRRIITAPSPYEGYAPPPAVLATRRLAAPPPAYAPVEAVPVGAF